MLEEYNLSGSEERKNTETYGKQLIAECTNQRLSWNVNWCRWCCNQRRLSLRARIHQILKPNKKANQR
ncbi:hypothetical protein Bca4012_039556 [Brassica carinata]